MEKLAIFGGKPVRTKPFPVYSTLDENEERAVVDVIRDGILSDFIGADGPFFMGGKRVRQLEEMYKQKCGVKYAISMNSATSVIFAAMAAFGIGPGDEVIVSPYSHVISATAPLFYDGIPVFADSEDDTFCMSVESIEACITPRTKAIIVVDLFGQSADMDSIMELARRHNVRVLSDSAHITEATYKGKFAGSLAHIGSFSLNCHKTIQCGEGGIAITNDDDLALRLQLVRNHAENCVESMGYNSIINMVGLNLRITELEASVAIEQLKKSRRLIEHRRMLCEYLNNGLKDLPGITIPKVREGCTHDYLLYCLKYDASKIGVPIDEFKKRLDAEGIKMTVDDKRHIPSISGFVKPIHLQPVFQRKIFRPNGYPWSGEAYMSNISYAKGICPVVEDLWENTLICINAIYPPLEKKDMDDIINAFKKVIELSRK